MSFTKIIDRKCTADPALISRVTLSDLVDVCIQECNSHPGVEQVRKVQIGTGMRTEYLRWPATDKDFALPAQ